MTVHSPPLWLLEALARVLQKPSYLSFFLHIPYGFHTKRRTRSSARSKASRAERMSPRFQCTAPSSFHASTIAGSRFTALREISPKCLDWVPISYVTVPKTGIAFNALVHVRFPNSLYIHIGKLHHITISNKSRKMTSTYRKRHSSESLLNVSPKFSSAPR